MKRKYKIFAGTFSLAVCSVLGLVVYMQLTLPDEFYVVQGEKFAINSKLNIEADGIVNKFPVELYSKPGNSYNVDLKMFGTIGIKQVNVQVIERSLVIPGGNPFGLKMFTEGVLVVGMTDMVMGDKTVNPAKEAGISIGDIILKIDNQEVSTNEDVAKIVSRSNGRQLRVELKRGEQIFSVMLKPARSPEDNSYKAGIWVRDSSAGIGTMTYYEPATMSYGGLGHAICDIDTGEIMPLSSGEIVGVTISGVKRGYGGTPGELRGSFTPNSHLGSLDINNETGVYGELSAIPVRNKPIPLALKHEIKTGFAQIYTTIEGNEPKPYSIMIEKVNMNDGSSTKNMVIKVTDPELIEKTGGIIQGMSGSPIIQGGKLVGAVTHVFVNEPTRGYAIFAENMNKTLRTLDKKAEIKQNIA